MYAVVKTIATMISLMFLIDRTGRRILLMISATGASAAMWYIGAFVTAANIDITSATSSRTGGGWVAIICIYVYAASFSLAWNGVVWVYCAEIFPSRIKELAVSLTTATQWIAQFAVARASPYMLSDLRGGFFFFWAASMVVMGVLVFFFVPETKGRSLEKMDEVFGTPYNREAEVVELSVGEKNAEGKVTAATATAVPDAGGPLSIRQGSDHDDGDDNDHERNENERRAESIAGMQASI